MNSKFLYLCGAISLFISLNVVGNPGAHEPEWFTKFQKEYEQNNKKRSNKWCALFQCLPQEVQEALKKQIMGQKIEYKLFSFPLYNRTLYSYAVHAATLNKWDAVNIALGSACLFGVFRLVPRLFRKNYLRDAVSQLVKEDLNHQPLADEYQQKSFWIMLNELQKISQDWYPGRNIQRCIEKSFFGIVKQPTVY